jgi:hypothetical protein
LLAFAVLLRRLNPIVTRVLVDHPAMMAPLTPPLRRKLALSAAM